MKKTLIFLIFLSISIIFFEYYFYCLIPEKLLMPLVGTNAIVVTLILAYISYSQWQKSRLENEVLKEQLKLIIEYLNYMQKNYNSSTLLSKKEDKILLSSFIPFSIINYNSLLNLESTKYITHQFKTKELHWQWFNEVNNDIIYNPFFPKRLFEIIIQLDTKKYFMLNDFGSHWCFKQTNCAPENQLVLLQGLDKEELNTKMLKLPYKNDYLRVSDIISIYEEFNTELEKWLKKNNININLNIKHNYT
ncbi:hypothetical protein [Sulfurimonas sp.]|uniref:hypothetical protein n=1 Tax=Sulfurimonas sp. TaxID=2022749 RepID=UPI00262EE229|nr:hypothetical protein [Sulfurimonas sp.]MCW8894435.1 hypothetical protein [Sulfurimonas sp.]